jgi:ABC-type antimicrobial peptide transport system permease subunit
MTMIVATPAASPDLIAEIGRRLAAVPGGREPPKALTLEEHLARTSLGPERIATLVVSASALIALALALLGVYGVMSDAVLQKKREIALKLALGARARAIIAAVFRDGFRIAVVGGAGGLLLSWTLVQWVVHANAGFHAPSLWVWLACPPILLVIVAVASILPARWALAVNPLIMTREE